MVIRDEASADRLAVHELVCSAFGQPAEARLVDTLTKAGYAVFSLVAQEGAAIVGHVLLSRMKAPFRALALAPVSVTPERQNAGIGSALVRSAVERARQARWDAIFVLGDPAYYKRFGFNAGQAAGFSTPYAGEHFMVLALSPPLPARVGALHHAPAFAALD